MPKGVLGFRGLCVLILISAYLSVKFVDLSFLGVYWFGSLLICWFAGWAVFGLGMDSFLLILVFMLGFCGYLGCCFGGLVLLLNFRFIVWGLAF